MMTLRAGRRAVQLSFAALLGVAGSALPAAAQSYLADSNNSSVTVDYSVLGQPNPAGAPGMVTRAPLPMGALPAASCNCGAAPLGVIASAPQPTFNSPYGNTQAMQAPAVPPGFLTYAQAVGAGGSSSGQRVVLRAPGGTSGASMAAAPSTEGVTSASSAAAAPLAPTTETANEAGATTGTSAPLPATTQTQTANASGASSGEATAPSTGGETGTATPPSQPDQMPQSVPSPVEQPATGQNAAPTQPTEGTTAAPATENAPAAAAAPANPPAAPAAPATPPAATADNSAAQPAPSGNDQQAAVTPPAPASAPAANAPATGGLPAGATRILYTSDADDVPGNATAELDKIAQQMQADENMRVQVMAYAAGTEDTESKARRKSLARGLAVRSYLIKAGVRSTRIDVRALGSKAEGGPADRVDIIPAS